ncbi:hypothetical protein [Lacticaseibacillus saniviri]|nr:hypothetical protein [Lacticaseibacillus saniviri]
MIDIVYQAIKANQRISELAGKRIAKYEYPESADHTQLFIVISPVGPQQADIGGSDQLLSWQYTFQVNVEGKIRKDVKEAQHIIREIMMGFSFAQMTDGIDEFFSETNRFADARRYRGNTKLYDTNY